MGFVVLPFTLFAAPAPAGAIEFSFLQCGWYDTEAGDVVPRPPSFLFRPLHA